MFSSYLVHMGVSERAGIVEAARQGWIRRLYDLSRRNNLLYYRPLKAGTLDLSAADAAALAALLAGDAVGVGRLLPGTIAKDLTTRVTALRRQALANREERGVETLYLALGMATWSAEDEGRAPAAGVLLAPVAITLHGREGRSATLQFAGETQANLVLLHLLEAQFNCRVDAEALAADAQESGTAVAEGAVPGPTEVAERLRAAVHDVLGFSVTPTAVLGNFAFQKIAMVRDLETNLGAGTAADRAGTSPAPTSDLVAAVAGDPGARALIRGAAQEVTPAQIDLLHPDEEFLVFDADSSQQRVILAALGGQSGVVQGPPGTGKSQTIANLITSLAARGKRVLFVAEKRAALEVVLRRLEGAGLGHLALDLHGADVSRREIMGRVADALERLRVATPVNGTRVWERFAEVRRRLNTHVADLHTPHPPTDLTVYEMEGRLLALPEAAWSDVRWAGDRLMSLDTATAQHVRDLLAEASGMAGLFLGTDPSPWTGARFADGAAAQRAVETARRLARDGVPGVQRVLPRLVKMSGLSAPTTVAEAGDFLHLLAGVAETLGQYDDDLFTEDLGALATALGPAAKGGLARSLAWVTNPAYRRAVRTMQRHRREESAPGPRLLAEAIGAAYWTHHWAALAGEKSTGPRVVAGAEKGRAAWERLEDDLTVLQEAFPEADLTALSLEELGARCAALAADAATAQRLPRLWAIEQELVRLECAPLIVEIRRGGACSSPPDRAGTSPAPTWPALFDHAWLSSCLEQVRADNPTLAAFSGRTQDALVAEFCALDSERLTLAAAHLRRVHAEGALAAMRKYPAQEDVVRHEAQKKTRHRPLRTLLAQAPDVLTALFPCWMASPLSVSQLLDAGRRYFDVVVFDEASQILPEDAVPALMRADHTVVAGDSRQLPPTTFFTLQDDEDEDEEPGPTEGFESLLDVMGTFLPAWPLEWHYRSRDEALIAFSNAEIYGNSLITFPSPGGPPALRHVLVQGTADDGESSAAEVRRVVELVLEHAAARPEETLGVIALGLTHAARLETALDRALEARQELEPFFDERREERFFVKNLERVQGDERDAIILSVGYGKDASGRLPYRFGPLLQEGGERRLNVAITRARRRMTVVSSFGYADMDPARSDARGVQLLRAYLQYADGCGAGRADSRTDTLVRPQDNGTDDPLLADIQAALEAAGLTLTAHLGASRYRLDLAAARADDPARYTLAIETDGPAYAAVPTARERDRLRRRQLEALGWRCHRLWSGDWVADREGEMEQVVEAWKEAENNT